MKKSTIAGIKYRDKWDGTKKMDLKLQEFDSIHDYTSYIDKAPLNTIFNDGNRVSSQTGTASFTGTQSYQEATDLFQSGWAPFAQKLTKRIPVTTKSAPVTKSRPAYSVVGGQASVPRYIQGIPTNMIDRRPVVVKQKIIIINKDISYSAGVSTHEIEEEGVKAIQIIQALEGKGYRVKLNMCWAVQNSGELLGLRITIKKPEERLSLNKIAFPIAHPSMLRRLGFKWLETNDDMVSSGFRYGYGTPATQAIQEALDKKEIFLPNFIPDVDKFIQETGY